MALQIMGGAPAQEKQKESDYEKIEKALSIVQGLTGTAMNLVQFKQALADSKLKKQMIIKNQQDSDAAKQDISRKKAGIKTPGEIQDLQLSGDITAAKEGEPGAIPVQVQGADGSPLIQFVKSNKGQPTQFQQQSLDVRKQQVASSQETNKLERKKLEQEIRTGEQKANTAERTQRAGQATIKGNIENLDGIIESLSSGQVKTGGAQALIPGSKARAILTPEVQDVRDRVVNIVFQSLKQALGGQFTQKEAEQLVDSELNLSLPNEYNIPRLQRLRDRVAAAAGNPELAAELKSSGGETKVLDGVIYKKVQGGWQKVK